MEPETGRRQSRKTLDESHVPKKPVLTEVPERVEKAHVPKGGSGRPAPPKKVQTNVTPPPDKKKE